MKSEVASKLTKLINDEAMKQLAENYHELLPKLVKIEVDHIEDDLSYAVGAIYFLVAKRIIFTPVVYRDGKVDSISYIGDTENETLYGLTKRMYKRLISASKLDFGRVMSKKEQDRLIVDKGIIGKLFATPQTMSPKVANDENYSDNVIISMLDNSIFAEAFSKFASMPEYDEVLHKIYSERVFEKLASVESMMKVASIVREDNGSMIFTKIADLGSLPKQKRGEAAMAIAKEGFYKVASDKEPTKAAVMNIPKMGEMLFKTKSSIEVLTEPGIYNALTRDLNLVPALVARHGLGNKNYFYYKDASVLVQNGSQPSMSKNRHKQHHIVKKEFIGMPAGAINDDPRNHIISVFGQEMKPNTAEKLVIAVSKDDLAVFDINTVTRVGNILVVKVFTEDNEDLSIEIGESHGYTKKGNVIYVNPNHVVFVGSKREPVPTELSRNRPDVLSSLLTTADLDSVFVKSASFDVTYSAGKYFYGGERLDKSRLTQELREDGYDDDSIHTIIKTAKDSNGVPVDFSEITLTLKAILAELAESKVMLSDLSAAITGEQGEQDAPEGQDTKSDMASAAAGGGDDSKQGSRDNKSSDGSDDQLLQAISQMASSVGADPKKILEAGKKQGMDLKQIAQQLQGEIAEVQQQGAQQQGDGQQQGSDQQQGDPNAQGGSPMEQDVAAAAQQSQNAVAGQDPSQDPSQGGAPQDPSVQQDPSVAQGPNTPQLGGQGDTEQQLVDLQQQGYNPNMTPEMLTQLQQIADKDVLNASIISYLIDTPDAKAVTTQYLDDIGRGVNGLARTLLLIEIQRTSFSGQIGDKQLNAFLSRGKTLLNRMTDFLIDVSIIN